MLAVCRMKVEWILPSNCRPETPDTSGLSSANPVDLCASPGPGSVQDSQMACHRNILSYASERMDHKCGEEEVWDWAGPITVVDVVTLGLGDE